MEKENESHDYGKDFYLTENLELAKEFVRDNVDLDILEELLFLGGLGIQCCIKSEKAYSNLLEIREDLIVVDYKELFNYFMEVYAYEFKEGELLKGFMPNWIGKFYAYHQWFYKVSSKEALEKVPLSFFIKAYPGLYVLDFKLAVIKVGVK